MSSLQDYQIKRNDILKLGRIKFRVKEFVSQTEKHENDETCEHDDVKYLENREGEEHDEAACRFCWSQEETDDNPKICVCQCSGSVGHIHFNCLKAWMKTKVQEVKHGSTVS